MTFHFSAAVNCVGRWRVKWPDHLQVIVAWLYPLHPALQWSARLLDVCVGICGLAVLTCYTSDQIWVSPAAAVRAPAKLLFPLCSVFCLWGLDKRLRKWYKGNGAKWEKAEKREEIVYGKFKTCSFMNLATQWFSLEAGFSEPVHSKWNGSTIFNKLCHNSDH